ncbi:MAG: amino acid--tRNA ligase-related protein [Candidatus Woesearchaeota archaeon]
MPFVFLTEYPSEARPFYTMPSGKNDGLTNSFDLIMNGLEVTTSGQRIHDYDMLIAAMKKNNMNLDEFEGYLAAFKYGMPPHGGFGIGGERLTAKFLGLENVRQASLFPRDRTRYSP